MHRGMQLLKEKIVTLSELQRNPSRALDGDIVRIVKNGKELGIYLSREEFEDIMEEHMELKPSFKKELNAIIKKSKKGKRIPLSDIHLK